MQEVTIHQGHVYSQINILPTISKRGHPRNIPVKLFQNQTSCSRGEDFKELLKKVHFITMATRVFDGIKFCGQFLKRTSQGTFLPNLVQTGPAVWEKKMFREIVEDTRQTQDHPKSSPQACCSGELKSKLSSK